MPRAAIAPAGAGSVPPTLLSYQDLRADGMSRRAIDRAVASGELVRVRRGRYVVGGTAGPLTQALSAGGRLDCVSLLQWLGVFVLAAPNLHVQVTHGASRMPPSPRRVIRHWRHTVAASTDLTADVIEALAQACRCQPPRAAIATLDGAWHLGLVDKAGIAAVFALLPPRFSALRPQLDPRSESGPETFMRLLLRALGCSVELQVKIRGVGHVDLVVDGWLIIECDSEAHHSSWQDQKRDRRRDLVAARQGFTTLRPIAEDIMYHADSVLAAVRGLLAARAAG